MDKTDHTGLPASRTEFNGSAIVTVPGSAAVVAAANELYTNRNVGTNFEGIPLARAGNTIYMATALCEMFSLDTYYAIQNASLSDDATVTITYRDQNGNQKIQDGPYTIGPGQKRSVGACLPGDTYNPSMNNYTGSAVIASSGAPIVVIGKAQCSVRSGTCAADKADVFTAFLGEPVGSSKIALPFVRWANDTRFNAGTNTGGQQRSFIAIQNLENSQSLVDVEYYDKNGAIVETQTLTIAGLAKGNSDAAAAGALGQNGMNTGEFGYYTDGSFGGAVIVRANAANPNAQFIAIVRVQHPGGGEDYNGVPVQ
jgi:hypothetical protein